MAYLEWKDITGGNSKSFVIPPGIPCQLLYGYINLVTSSALGSRRIKLQISDTSGSVLYENGSSGFAQKELDNSNYPLHSGLGSKGVDTPIGYTISIPENFVVVPGYTITVKENKGISVLDNLSIYAILLKLV